MNNYYGIFIAGRHGSYFKAICNQQPYKKLECITYVQKVIASMYSIPTSEITNVLCLLLQ